MLTFFSLKRWPNNLTNSLCGPSHESDCKVGLGGCCNYLYHYYSHAIVMIIRLILLFVIIIISITICGCYYQYYFQYSDNHQKHCLWESSKEKPSSYATSLSCGRFMPRFPCLRQGPCRPILNVSCGVRTHAQLPAVDLKSTPSPTRAKWLMLSELPSCTHCNAARSYMGMSQGFYEDFTRDITRDFTRDFTKIPRGFHEELHKKVITRL